jgi:8-oxo-dGTP pyrophosphatase MutT (NUDIX family)
MEKEITTTVIVAGVVINRDKKYLLVQEKQPRAYGLWNLPAGRVDKGDSIEITAIKEAKEEAGVDVELIRKIDIFQQTADEPVKHAFEAKIVGGEVNFPEDEILDARWFAFDEIKSMKEKLRGEWVLSAIESVENKVI